jgi:hypothetical protein
VLLRITSTVEAVAVAAYLTSFINAHPSQKAIQKTQRVQL